jgi:hypothetical protein
MGYCNFDLCLFLHNSAAVRKLLLLQATVPYVGKTSQTTRFLPPLTFFGFPN